MAGEGEESDDGWAGRLGRVVAVAGFLAILLAPRLEGLAPAAQRLAAITFLMGSLWVTQGLPFAATSLLPLALFPLLGIQSAKQVAGSYFSDSSFLYFGGFVISLGIERWGLHRRMAMCVLEGLGASPRGIVLGFLLATGALSMWISNTATALLMTPIALATLASIQELTGDDAESRSRLRRLQTAVMLSIAYGASIGGVMTLVGTPTNIAYVEIARRLFPDAPRMSAGQWMTIWIPFGVVFLAITWLVLTWHMPREATHHAERRFDRSYFREQRLRLGRPGAGESWMTGLFVATALLWIFRTDFALTDAPLVPGWERLTRAWLASLGVPEAKTIDYVNDSTVAIGVAVLMFLIPVERSRDGRTEYLMDWSGLAKLPWGVLLLFGGGFAIAEGFRSTGLAEWIGQKFAVQAEGLPTPAIVLLTGLMMIFLTEFTSNVATVNALLPILAAAACALEIDPRLVMIPATVCASCGFMMPVGTPPNAIVYGTGFVSMREMVRYGFVLNVIGAALCFATSFALLAPQQKIPMRGLPAWARPALAPASLESGGR